MRRGDTISRPRQYALLVLSGVMLVLAFPPIDFLPAAFLALVPFFYVLQQTRATGFWSAFRPGLVAGLAFFVPLFYWMILLSSRQMENPIIMSGPLILLVLLESFYWGLFSAGTILVGSRTSVPRWVALPVLWVACEQLRSLFVIGFTWGALGYAGITLPRAVQFASVTGVFGVSFWMVLVNVLVLELITVRPARRRAFVWALVAALVLPVLHGSLVVARDNQWRSIRVAVVQPNIEAKRKWDSDYRHVSFEVLEELTREAAKQNPDLIVWPETATPSRLLYEPDDLAWVVSIASEAGAPVLTGMPHYRRVQEGPRPFESYNSSLLVMPDGTLAGKYDKIHLVPFGEAIPFESVFPILEKVDFGEADFRVGTERVVFEIPEVRFATLICYESIFPRLVRQFVDGGAELLLNITNDAWYGRTSMPYQHASMAVMRSIENRRSLARSANSGVSMVVDPHGRVLARTAIFERTFLVHDLPVVSEKTLYSEHGDVFPWSAVGLSILLVAAAALGIAGRPRQD